MKKNIIRLSIVLISLLIFHYLHNTDLIHAEDMENHSHIKNDTRSVLTEEEISWLKVHPIIRIAPDPEFKPIEFFDKDGKYSGIAAEYLNLIGERFGINFDVIHCADWSSVIELVKRREVDILNAVVRTDEREKYLKFTSPYLEIPSVIIVRKSVKIDLKADMLKGMKVVMVSGYGYIDIVKKHYPEIEITAVPDLKIALRKVSFGMADAFIGDLATASFYIESEGITNLRVGGESEPPNISGFAVRSDWPELLSILEKGISLITAEERQSIYKRWVHLAPEPGIDTGLLKRVALITAGVVSIILLVILLWNRILRSNVEERTERALEESEAHLRTLIKTIPDLVWFKDPDGIYLACNSRFERFFGAPEEKIIGKSDFDFLPREEAEFFRKYDRAAMEKGAPSINEEVITYADDDHRELLETVKTPIYGSNGKLIGVLGIARDITERKKAEEERQALQDQLFQARKMDAVGRLAGGVAHDFNNMLSIIIGRAELARMKLAPSNPVYSDLVDIEAVGKRSADLTRQLLAFARKQTIAPEVLDLNITIENMLKMLRRLIGENMDLLWKPTENLWKIRMDPTQIDQLLANLVINARDAMRGNTGRISIETGNALFEEDYCSIRTGFMPGEYVFMTVIDNGCGMDNDTLENIFEPFFTTKGLGQGTGLGLATIYGIVKQNCGFINVYSEPDKGSTFRIYLPRYIGETPLQQQQSTDSASGGGTESILLVEDEPEILEVVRTALENLGYRVIATTEAGRALEIASESSSGSIDLLITDVIMPEMNGSDLAKKIRQLTPSIKILFMSGYTADIIANHGVLEQNAHFIQKPFSMANFASKVREVMQSESS